MLQEQLLIGIIALGLVLLVLFVVGRFRTRHDDQDRYGRVADLALRLHDGPGLQTHYQKLPPPPAPFIQP